MSPNDADSPGLLAAGRGAGRTRGGAHHDRGGARRRSRGPAPSSSPRSSAPEPSRCCECSTTPRTTSTPCSCCDCSPRPRRWCWHSDDPGPPRARAVDLGPRRDRADVRDALRGRRGRPADDRAPAQRGDLAVHCGHRARAGPDHGTGAEAAHPDRQRDHARQGLLGGSVLLRGRAARDGRPRRGLQPDRVRREQDDPLRLRARRHLGARGDGPAHRRGLHRAHQDPAPGDVAVPAQWLLAHPGGGGGPRRHRRIRLPQGHQQARLRPPGSRRPPSRSSR